MFAVVRIHRQSMCPAPESTRTARAAALLAAALALAAPAAARAYDKTFSIGSLIIPAQQEYQSDAGMISAYGLVYTLLWKNTARVAAGARPITVYWIVQPRKQSHHRCWSGDDTLPDYSRFNDNDACDFTVQSDAGRPVSKVGPDGRDVSPFWACGLDATSSSALTRNAAGCDPQTVAAASGGAGTKRFPAFEVGARKKVMKYAGGAWVIDAPDRNAVLELLANDADLAQYHKAGTCRDTAVDSGCHHVSIHSANASFTAPVARMINAKPPLIALLGAEWVGTLEAYLTYAGLTNITDKAGPLARDRTTGAITRHGVIYDVLDPVTDFVSKASTGPLAHGILNYPADPSSASSPPYYQVLWAPHWVAAGESTPPRDGTLGDDRSGDWRWTHAGDDAITNALKNIAWFADQGNGIFAECASIESFEGSYREGTDDRCRGTLACELTSDTTQTTPYQCAAGSEAACNACYSCPAGMGLDASSCAEVTCVGTCAAGATAACGACYTCPAGQVVNADNCNDVTCVPSSGCPADATAACNGCYTCASGWTLSEGDCRLAPTCHQCRSAGYTYSPGLRQCYQCNGTWNEARLQCMSGGNSIPYLARSARSTAATTPDYPSASRVATSRSAATAAAPTCPSGYALFCPGVTLPVDVEGNEATHFQVSNRVLKNGLGNRYIAPDCTDRQASVVGFHDGGSGDCFDFHPELGGPGNVFSQKGNFSYSGTWGHIHQYKPPTSVGSVYQPNVFRMVTSRNAGNASRDDWDFASHRHKDGDPAKGLVVYLAGHTYARENFGGEYTSVPMPAGIRMVLNTLLNLGFSSAGVELARSEPVGYRDVALKKDRVYQGTYVQLPPPGPYQDWAEYTVGSTQSWRFPYTTGHLYEYDLTDLSAAPKTFGVAEKNERNWDAAERMPAPGRRVVFTAVGGSGNLGWRKVSFQHEETEPGCVDTDGNRKCDLSEKLAACATAGVTTATLQTHDVSGAQRDALGMFVQQVRGFCSAHSPKVTGTPIFTPSDDQCDDLKQQKNRARLGGIDHGSPAVVGPSRYLPDAPWSTRPVVAYAGARDGMLHAFYVSGNRTNDAVWKDPAGDSLPADVQPGQELWAFVPPAQLCGLATNNAMVDASVNVIDVFGDFPVDKNADGVIDWSATAGERPTGVRSWRTVLLAAAGQGGSELFAMDVTNPLKPVLLWHVSGVTERDGRWDTNGNGAFAAGEVFDAGDQRTYAWKWQDAVDASGRSAPDGVTKVRTGRWDYANLGLTYGTAVGKVHEGNAYRFIGYVAASTADFTDPSAPLGYRGLEVFAFDLVSGQKLWQWQRRYGRKNGAGMVIADNTIPGRMALADVDADGSVDRVYVGDMEGHLWELDARRGGNLNTLPAAATPSTRYSFPLFGTKAMVGTDASAATKALFRVDGGSVLAQQPLTTPIGLGRFTQVPKEPRDLTPYLLGRLAVVEGTMGVDWAIAPFEKGTVYVVPVHWEQNDRIAYFQTGQAVDLDAEPDPLLHGLLVPDAAWGIPLQTGERVFGMPRVVNNTVLFTTSFGSFTGDISDSASEAGNLYVVRPDRTTVTPNDAKSFGGILLFQDKLVITTATGIRAEAAPTGVSGGTPAARPFNRSTPAIFRTWEPQPAVPRP